MLSRCIIRNRIFQQDKSRTAIHKKEKPAFAAGLYFVYSESLGWSLVFILSCTVLVLIARQDYSPKCRNLICLAEAEQTIVETDENNPAAIVFLRPQTKLCFLHKANYFLCSYPAPCVRNKGKHSVKQRCSQRPSPGRSPCTHLF